MILLVGGLVAATLVGLAAALLMGAVVKSKVLGVLVWLLVTPSIAFLPVAASLAGSAPADTSFSHAQLEADSVMIEAHRHNSKHDHEAEERRRNEPQGEARPLRPIDGVLRVDVPDHDRRREHLDHRVGPEPDQGDGTGRSPDRS